MIRRLSAIDLPRRLPPGPPRLAAELGVGVAASLLALGVRMVLDFAAPGVAPYTLLFPALLLATLCAGWRAGLTTLTLGLVGAWRLVVEPGHSLIDRSAGQAVSAGLFAFAAGLLLLMSAAFRRVALAEAAEGYRIAIDITERKAAEQRTLESEARLRLAVEAGRMAVWRVEAGVIDVSPELKRMLGIPPDADVTLDGLNAGYLPGEQARVRAAAAAAIGRGERFFEVEYRYRRFDGEVRWMLIRAEIRNGPDGAPSGAMGVLLDVTDRKKDEERLRLLAREVDHRANNLMTVVQGIVTLSRAGDAENLKAVIVGRVSALARAHQLLAEARWEGADLRRLVQEELLAFSLGDGGRVDIQGENVALGPAAAQGIAMALHELATNAAKYGALSRPQGRVAVSWEAGADPLAIRWVESGGPPVAKPRRKGLGATILQRALSGSLGGQARLDWRPDGLVCELELPFERARNDLAPAL